MQSLLQQDVPETSWHLTSALILLPTLAFISTPSAHTLQIRSASWLYLWVLCVTRVGLGKPWQARAGRWAAYIAGVLLALGHICERTSHGDLFWVKVGQLDLSIAKLIAQGSSACDVIHLRPLSLAERVEATVFCAWYTDLVWSRLHIPYCWSQPSHNNRSSIRSYLAHCPQARQYCLCRAQWPQA